MSIVLPNSGPTSVRSRYRSHHKSFGSAALLNLPSTIGRLKRAITDQQDTEYCTAYGEAVSNGYEHNIDMSPEWQVGIESNYAGAPITSGASPETSMEATELFGSLPAVSATITMPPYSADYIADWQNFPKTQISLSESYLPGIPYEVDGPYDTFDNIRTVLYQAYAQNGGVVKVFGPWYQSWNLEAQNPVLNGVVSLPPSTEDPISSHRWNFVDWIPSGNDFLLVAHMTQGKDFGDKGFVYFDRATVNSIFTNATSRGYGIFISRPRKSFLAGLYAYWQAIINHMQLQLS